MKALLQSLLVGFMITSLVACTSMRTVSDLPSNMQEKVHEGDRVRVWTQSGEVRGLIVTSVDNDTLHGTKSRTDTRQVIHVPRDQIIRLDVKRFSPLKTVVLIGAIFLVFAQAGWEVAGGM